MIGPSPSDPCKRTWGNPASGLIEPSGRRAADDDVARLKLEAHPFGPVINGPALAVINHLEARSRTELHDVARRAVIGL